MAKFTFDASGFDDVMNELNDIADKAHDLNGTKVSLFELFDSDYMDLHANSLTIDEFLSRGNAIVESEEDLESLSSDEFNLYVSDNTDFSSWDEMLEDATNSYLEKQLGL